MHPVPTMMPLAPYQPIPPYRPEPKCIPTKLVPLLCSSRSLALSR